MRDDTSAALVVVIVVVCSSSCTCQHTPFFFFSPYRNFRSHAFQVIRKVINYKYEYHIINYCLGFFLVCLVPTLPQLLLDSDADFCLKCVLPL